MSDETAGEGPVPGREYEGIVYVGEDGEPEVTPESKDAHLEEKVVELPPLMTAADLLEDDPLTAIPVEPPDSDTPPDPTPLTDKMYGPRGTAERDAFDALQRERAVRVTEEVQALPVMQKAMAQEAVRLAQKQAVQEAFVKAQKAKK